MGVRVPTEDDSPLPDFRPRRPPRGQAVALFALLFMALVINGRPIGSGDARPTERVAASLVRELDFDLDEYQEVDAPFARKVGAHRVSIYPVLSAALAAPLVAGASLAFALDETGLALVGKWAASLFTAAAAVLLFLFLGARHPFSRAQGCAIVFALGTTMWSTSQALWQHPAAVLCLVAALVCLQEGEADPRWVERAGLPLGLMVAARHADVAIAVVLTIAIALRWPSRLSRLAAWAAGPALFVLAYHWFYFASPFAHGFSGSASRFNAPWGEGHLGLLVSPAKGLLIFTPVVLCAAMGMHRAFRTGDRFWVGMCATAALAHWLLMGRWSEWHGGESFGPRLLTDALPLLFVFLPEGLQAFPRLTTVLAAVSIFVQAVGAFAYDYSWERTHQRPRGDVSATLWDAEGGPLPFHLRRRTLIFALPGVTDGRAHVREHPLVLGGGGGSRITFGDAGPQVTGVDETLVDVHLQRGAKSEADRARLRGRWDAVFLRIADGARGRRLELRITGSGQGTLYVGERSFWSPATRWSVYPMAGPLAIRHPYEYATSGGPDLVVSVGKGGGSADIESLALVPAGEPERVYR